MDAEMETKGYPVIVTAVRVIEWINSRKTFPTAQEFQERFGGHISTAHRWLNAIEAERGITRPRRVNGEPLQEAKNAA
ncbi:hypothetical protein [Pseudoxanthomonas sp. PXM04]|uniref:hypothetical protein n=1 Tax=Pseudoxanthomonas sp. PXM04 TaxID=2769297 RepID=UPI001784D5AC|nr:hypothetical protein [Pseudoxanthomonas sp. PXM04]MBD9376181.1 hypothetical protein [Pseudoxanthomonas sp. PXM04]